MLLLKIVGRNWPKPCATQTRDQPRASHRRHAQWQVSAHLPQSASIHLRQSTMLKPCWEQKARAGLGLQAAAWGGSLQRFLLPDLQPGPTTESRQTQAGPAAGGEPRWPLPAGRDDEQLKHHGSRGMGPPVASSRFLWGEKCHGLRERRIYELESPKVKRFLYVYYHFS